MTTPMLSGALEQRLAHCANLPTPPAVAVRLIELGRDPDVELGQLVEVIKLDPALSAKLLRIANSALYGGRRQARDLRQALFMLGMKAVLSLALSFTLVRALDREEGRDALDYTRFWRRSLLAGLFSQALGDQLRIKDGEELFLAGLLQDIGMLALDRALPDLYRGGRALQSRHDELVDFERVQLRVDHGDVAAWLLARWNLPERIVTAVAASHGRGGSDESAFSRCVGLSGVWADVWISAERETVLRAVADQTRATLALTPEQLSAAMGRVAEQILEVEELFEMPLTDPTLSDMIVEQAHEVLLIRNLQAIQESSGWRKTAESWRSRVEELEEQGRRDNLTGVFNRAHLDRILADEVERARVNDWPLTVAFADLDHFKRVNDTHGHQVGDRVLQSAARLLVTSTRSTDIIARYGGEEFVLLLPGCGQRAAAELGARIVSAFRSTAHHVGPQTEVMVTRSLGMATYGDGQDFESAEALLRAADRALYAAKLGGWDRSVVYGE